jgi:hypothetical protein
MEGQSLIQKDVAGRTGLPGGDNPNIPDRPDVLCAFTALVSLSLLIPLNRLPALRNLPIGQLCEPASDPPTIQLEAILGQGIQWEGPVMGGTLVG